jgi:hypothetical protein
MRACARIEENEEKKRLDRTKQDSIIWQISMERTKTIPQSWNDAEAEPDYRFRISCRNLFHGNVLRPMTFVGRSS